MKSKDAQDLFEAHCEQHLTMSVELKSAQDAYHLAYDSEVVEHKKRNAGMRAMNQYLYGRLKEIGWHQWKPDEKGNKPKRQTPVSAGRLTQQERDGVAGKNNGKMPEDYKGKILRDAGL